jgi:hypothetical protein
VRCKCEWHGHFAPIQIGPMSSSPCGLRALFLSVRTTWQPIPPPWNGIFAINWTTPGALMVKPRWRCAGGCANPTPKPSRTPAMMYSLRMRRRGATLPTRRISKYLIPSPISHIEGDRPSTAATKLTSRAGSADRVLHARAGFGSQMDGNTLSWAPRTPQSGSLARTCHRRPKDHPRRRRCAARS